MFFIATADRDGQPDCSYKGGLPGFVRVLDEHTYAHRARAVLDVLGLRERAAAR